MARVFLNNNNPTSPALPDDLCVISSSSESRLSPLYLRWGRYVKEFHQIVKDIPWQERRWRPGLQQWEINHAHLALLVTEARKVYPHVRVVIGGRRDEYIWEGFHAAA